MKCFPGEVVNKPSLEMLQIREKITRNCPAGNISVQILDMNGKALQISSLIYILLQSHEAEQRHGNNGWRSLDADDAEACLDASAMAYISESAQSAACQRPLPVYSNVVLIPETFVNLLSETNQNKLRTHIKVEGIYFFKRSLS